MYKFLILLIYLINNLCFSFDYEVQTHAKRTIIKTIPISETIKYISFILEGTWTDNLGNYGMMEQSSFVMLDNNDVIFHLNEDIGKTFTGLVSADILVISPSSFSYTAALISDGEIYYKKFWHKPKSNWIKN